MGDFSGLVRARPKTINIREIWNTAFSLAANDVPKFEPHVAVKAEVVVPLDDTQCMPEHAWDDIAEATKATAHQGRIGVLAIIASDRERVRTGAVIAPSILADDALHSQDERWTAFPVDLPVKQLFQEFTSSDARAGQDAIIPIAFSAHRGDLRPISTKAYLSTDVERLLYLSDIVNRIPNRELQTQIINEIVEHLRKPEAERGEYRLLLRISIRTDLMGGTQKTIKLKYFAIDWPFYSDGSDVHLGIGSSKESAGNSYPLIYDSSRGRAEIGDLDIPSARNEGGRQEFEIVLKLMNTDLQRQTGIITADMTLELEGSVLGIQPLYGDWSGEIIAQNGVASKVALSQSTEANIALTINLKDLFDYQYYAFRYRLRLRGVDINAERIQYVKQILAERTMNIKAEGISDRSGGGAAQEWLLIAERAIQGERLVIASLVRCETRRVSLVEGSETDRVQREATGADTTIDVLGLLRGKRDELMNEVNAYVGELRHQLGRFATRR